MIYFWLHLAAVRVWHSHVFSYDEGNKIWNIGQQRIPEKYLMSIFTTIFGYGMV